MSAHNPSHDPGPHGIQKEDRIDFPKVIAVGVVSLIIFALATWWAISILHSERASLKGRGEGRMTAELGKHEIGIVDQVPFQDDKRLDVWKKERAEWLGQYGWVDRAHGVIHIPIERAMDEIIGGASPPPPASSGVTMTPPPAPARAPQ
jgi:hypothetical protein